jgi:uncharacterized protein YkvS
MVAMAELSVGDIVELTESVDAAPAGAQGGVTDILDNNHVIVEVTTLPLEPILDRIIVASPEELRLVRGKRART